MGVFSISRRRGGRPAHRTIETGACTPRSTFPDIPLRSTAIPMLDYAWSSCHPSRAKMVEILDCVVIGAGVVGLAIARRLARAGREVVVLEAADQIGTEISSRNSEVIHAGIYYKPGSLKARLCVEGKAALYRFCAEHAVGHQRVGKLLVATEPDQLRALDALRRNAESNGVDDLTTMTAADARSLEPELACAAAILSPSTGIVDSHGLMAALASDAAVHGATIVLDSPVRGGAVVAGGLELEVGGRDPVRIGARTVINAAGLDAPALGAAIAGLPQETVPKAYWVKGCYFTLSGRPPPFRRLIYPMPVDAWLGIHVTVDLSGQVRFGPDIDWVEERSYDVDPARAASFYPAIRSYWPGLPDGALQPGYSGIRPRIVPNGVPAPDFVIQGHAVHGVYGLVNLYGIESPGLTSCIAIGDYVAAMLGE